MSNSATVSKSYSGTPTNVTPTSSTPAPSGSSDGKSFMYAIIGVVGMIIFLLIFVFALKAQSYAGGGRRSIFNLRKLKLF